MLMFHSPQSSTRNYPQLLWIKVGNCLACLRFYLKSIFWCQHLKANLFLNNWEYSGQFICSYVIIGILFDLGLERDL